MSRGLDPETLDAAEQAGALLYTHGAVLLVARDERGVVQNVIRRGYLPDDPHPKRALAGSDTSYAVVLPGDPARVTVAEGPVSGLAVQALARLRGQPVPTVVVTGGVTMRRWVRRALSLLVQAKEVVIAAEREDDYGRQLTTDAARSRLVQEIREVSGRSPKILDPPPGCGDAADELAAERRAEEERRLEEERRRQAEAEAEAECRRQLEEQRRLQAEERARHTPEARRQAILDEELRAAAEQMAQARTSWEKEAVEAAARMRAMDRWRVEGIMPQEPRPSRNRRRDEEWEPPVPRM